MMGRVLQWMLVMIALLLPMYLVRFSVGPLPMTVLEVLILATVVVWIGSRPDFGRLCGHKGLLIACGLFLVAGTIAMLVAPELRTAAGLWRAYIVEPMLVGLMIAVSATPQTIERLVTAIAVSVGVVSTWAVVQYFWLPDGVTLWSTTIGEIPNAYWRAEATRRATSVFPFPNAVALFVAPWIPMLALHNWWYRGVAVLACVAVVLSQSLGAVLGVGAAVFVWMVWYTRWTRVVAIVGAVALGLVLWLVPPQQLATENLYAQKSWSGRVRTSMWAETVEQLTHAPSVAVLGNGLGGYQEAVKPFHRLNWAEIYLYPHNIVLNFWSEVGALGVIAFALLIGCVVRLAYRVRGPVAIGIIGAAIVIVVHGVVDVPYFKNDLAVAWWMLVGMAVVLAAPSQKSRKSVQ